MSLLLKFLIHFCLVQFLSFRLNFLGMGHCFLSPPSPLCLAGRLSVWAVCFSVAGFHEICVLTHTHITLHTHTHFCFWRWMIGLFQGTVLIKNAEELMSFSKGEEDLMEAVSVWCTATVVVSPMCLQYLVCTSWFITNMITLWLMRNLDLRMKRWCTLNTVIETNYRWKRCSCVAC